MNHSSSDLDQLVLALAHWLEAADTGSGDPLASTRALEEARRRLANHRRLMRADTAALPVCTAQRPVA